MAEELSEDLKKALKDILPASDYETFIKGNASAAPVANNEGADGGDEKAIEKAFKVAKTELKGLKKAFCMKKGELSKSPDLKELKKAYKSKKKEIKKGFPDFWAKEKEEKESKKTEKKEGKKGEKVEKSINTDLVKALTDSFSGKIDKIIESNDSLVKSQKDEIAELKKSIQIIGQQKNPFKSAATHSFLEKSVENEIDGNGKTILSVTANKEQLLSVLENAVEKATSPDIKKAIEADILAYNMADRNISEPIASYLYMNHNIKVVK